jgi:hypothetical protein
MNNSLWSLSFLCQYLSNINVESVSHASCYENAIEPLLSVEAFLDMSSYTTLVRALSLHNLCEAVQLDIHPEVSTNHFSHL